MNAMPHMIAEEYDPFLRLEWNNQYEDIIYTMTVGAYLPAGSRLVADTAMITKPESDIFLSVAADANAPEGTQYATVQVYGYGIPEHEIGTIITVNLDYSAGRKKGKMRLADSEIGDGENAS